MKILLIICPLLILLGCSESNQKNKSGSKADSTKLHALDIIQDKAKPGDDQLTFNCIDSISSKDPDTRDFYFIAFKKIAMQSDGALTDIVIQHLYDFINTQPKEFIAHYREMTPDERKKMIGLVGDEFYQSDNTQETKLEEYFQTVKNNCKDCNEPDQGTLDRFRLSVRDTVRSMKKENPD